MRSWGTTLFEIILPVFIMLILVAIRKSVSVDNVSATHYPQELRTMDSTKYSQLFTLMNFTERVIAWAPGSNPIGN